jgi:hypothetical protein
VSSIQGFNFDKEKLDYLLKLFEQGQMSTEHARELKLLLEEIHKKALDKGDVNLARDIASILMTLKGFLSGRINLVENIQVTDSVSVSKT